MFFEIIFVQVELVVLLRNLKILSSCKSTLKPNILSRPDSLLKTSKTRAFYFFSNNAQGVLRIPDVSTYGNYFLLYKTAK